MGIYLDYNASAPVDLRVLEYMNNIYMNSYGNADSRTHEYGDNARKIVEDARQSISDMIGRNKDEVFFTSGSTESNNIAVLGIKEYAERTGKKHIITSAIEHKAILQSAGFLEKNGFRIDYVKPHGNGRVRVEDVVSHISDETVLVSIMHVNNETGVIQPVKEIGDILLEKDILFHTDATQSAGKLLNEIKEISYDMMSFCAHKMYGPQGIGVLVLKKKRYKLPPVKPIMFGGSQEHGIRPGTLPVALIAGFGKACDIAVNEYMKNARKCESIKERLIKLLGESGLEYKINGTPEHTIFNTINISLKGVSSEALMLSSKRYCGISNGSACNSTEYKPSFVLSEMGIPIDEIENSIRISWGPFIELDDFTEYFRDLLSVAKSLIW